jgi:hypothetical protein
MENLGAEMALSLSLQLLPSCFAHLCTFCPKCDTGGGGRRSLLRRHVYIILKRIFVFDMLKEPVIYK